MVGTAVLRIVVSSASMKNATAISQGNSRLLAARVAGGAKGVIGAWLPEEETIQYR
jgi:hypothetical protein